MFSKRRFLALLLAVGTASVWAQVPVQPGELTVKSKGDISYVSGGVGASEQEALAKVKSKYNLWLTFAVTGTGAFLSDIPVTISDKAGQVLVEAVSAGPYFYARVPAGTYRLSVDNAGQVKTRTVSVPASGGVSEVFEWPRQ
jgi:hypothetical protein